MLLQRLFLLVGLTALPLLGLLTYEEIEEYRLRRAEIAETLLQQAHAVANEHERLLTGARYLLFALSHMPLLRRMDVAACQTVLSDIGREFRTYSAVAAFDRDRNPLCSSLLPDEVARLVDPALLDETLTSGSLSVGTVRRELERERLHLPLAMPFAGVDGAVAGTVLLTIDLVTVGERAAASEARSDAVSIVADRQGTIVLSRPGGWAGEPLPPALAAALSAPEPGVLETADPDGQPRLWAYLPVGHSPEGLFITTGRLKTAAFAAVNETIVRSVVVSLLVVALALAAAAWGAARFIHQPIAAILGAIDKWRPGDDPAVPRTGQAWNEFDRIGAAFAAIEKRANTLLDQREFLMKELQHRVLNTLQILTSVLGLQAYRAHTPEARLALEDAQQRVRAVAAVYHRLYELEHAQKIDLAQFLRALTQDMGEAYGAEEIADGVIEVDAETCYTEPAATITLAMVVTELIANAVKYAGRPNRPPRIALRCRRRADGGWCLEVEDDGPGLPEEMSNSKGGSLGMALVRRLVQQLGGSATFDNTSRGLHVSLFLPAAFARMEHSGLEETASSVSETARRPDASLNS